MKKRRKYGEDGAKRFTAGKSWKYGENRQKQKNFSPGGNQQQEAAASYPAGSERIVL